MKPARIIAEIGCNHRGCIETAKEMASIAKNFCGVDVVKFQKRTINECLSESEYYSPHPVAYNSYGKTYGEHREFLELTLDEHRELKRYCESINLVYSSSVWDITSTKEICSIDPKLIKIPSACNTNNEIIEHLSINYRGEIHVSLGMTTKEEERNIVSEYEKYGRARDLVLYACTSGYPVKDKEVCLKEITRLREEYGNKVKAIGFSGHHLGIAIDIGAYVLGAEWIERHFTLDRTWKGTDHAASLEPDGLRRLVRDIESVSKAMTHKTDEILPIEKVQREKLKWNRHAELV